MSESLVALVFSSSRWRRCRRRHKEVDAGRGGLGAGGVGAGVDAEEVAGAAALAGPAVAACRPVDADGLARERWLGLDNDRG